MEEIELKRGFIGKNCSMNILWYKYSVVILNWTSDGSHLRLFVTKSDGKYFLKGALQKGFLEKKNISRTISKAEKKSIEKKLLTEIYSKEIIGIPPQLDRLVFNCNETHISLSSIRKKYKGKFPLAFIYRPYIFALEDCENNLMMKI